MKKLMNHADSFVDQMLDGLCAAHPTLVRDGDDPRVIRRSKMAGNGKVGIVTGGGSGHMPLFAGYVGPGLIDACAVGNVFAGPTVSSCVSAIRAANAGRGVLRLYGNYGGDRMNFDLAGEVIEEDGIPLATVLGSDDIASAESNEAQKRRGVAGLVFAYKIAGAKAECGADLEAVAHVAAETGRRTRSIGVAFSPMQLPGVSAPTFTLDDDEIEMGMGIHGEPGIRRGMARPADSLADEMLDLLLTETPADADGRVSVMVNSLGATSLEELFIFYRRVAARVSGAGFRILMPLVGRYVTSLEMGGVSLSLVHLNDELAELLVAPASCPFWEVR